MSTVSRGSRMSIFSRIEIPDNARMSKVDVLDSSRFSNDPSSSVMNLSIDQTRNINLENFLIRHPADEQFKEANYDEMDLFAEEEEGAIKFPKYKPNDDPDLVDQNPSFRKFKIPFEIVSRQRYMASKARYEEQFRREIHKLIDYQASALEASYFVRIMSYTTFWPPLHNRHELEHTSNHFFQLTPKEKWRLQYIMSNNFT